jgi:beta-glucosidase/6-phospho-beta-glucosidase/beta-galactosidase
MPNGYSQPLFSVAHHVILSHALAVQSYRDEFQPTQGGVIGITLNGDMAIPYDESPESKCHLLRPLFCKSPTAK